MFKEFFSGVFGNLTKPPELINPNDYKEQPPYALMAFAGLVLVLIVFVFIKTGKK